MRFLAIESSCDETSAAVVEDGWKVLSCVIASSADLHKRTGGVVPEVAAREHVLAMIPVVEEALEKAFSEISDVDEIFNFSAGADPLCGQFSIFNEFSNFKIQKKWIEMIDAIAVTKEPGLVTSLLVGTETAKWLGAVWNKPVLDVNHIHGHVLANWLDRDQGKNGERRTKNEKQSVTNCNSNKIEFPVVVLTVSGGHNELMLLRSTTDWELLGESIDDAAGEAFDKVARILDLGFPGGPAIQRMTEERRNGRTEHLFDLFPRAWLNENNSDKWDKASLDFSFSGLKSEVLREVERRKKGGMEERRNDLSDTDTAEIAFAFQEAVCDVLSEKLVEAAVRHGAREVHLAGGVSANKRLREMVKERLDQSGLDVTFRVPEKMLYCTDNAAMIGAAAYWRQA